MANRKTVVYVKRSREFSMLRATLKKDNMDDTSVPMLKLEELYKDKVSPTLH